MSIKNQKKISVYCLEMNSATICHLHIQLVQETSTKLRQLESLSKDPAFAQEQIVDIEATAAHTFKIALAFGDDHVGVLKDMKHVLR